MLKGGGKFDRTVKVPHKVLIKMNRKRLPNKNKVCKVCKKRKVFFHHIKCNSCWRKQRMLNNEKGGVS